MSRLRAVRAKLGMDDDTVWSGVLTTAGSKVARAAVALLAALIVFAVAGAGAAVAAEAPTISIDQPLAGAFTSDQTPAFSGTASERRPISSSWSMQA